MNRLTTATLATAFAAASSLALLAVPGTALADKGEHGDQNSTYQTGEHGDKNCTNAAGHTRGWCKHGGDRDDRKKSHRNHRASSISGTVLSVSGNVVSFRLDNGQVVSVLDNNGTQLNVGQHYDLRGAYQNGQFVLGAANNGDSNGGNQHATSLSGNIVAVGTGTITLLGVPPVVINVQQAINNNATNGSLSVGRHITAYGYYSNNVFYATSIQ